MRGITDYSWFGRFSVAIVVGYFFVGFWPFAFRPPNHVSWLADRAGLHFEAGGVAYDPESFAGSGLNDATNPAANFTVEIWIKADREPDDNVYHLLTIHNDRLPADFVICQWKREFLLRGTIQHPSSLRKINEVGLDNALQKQKTRFITIRSDGAGTDFFADGLPAGHYTQFVVKPGALDGQLILGNDSSGKHPWSGSLFGLAIYNRALNPPEIAGHHALWTQGRARQLANAPGLTVFYLFNEGGGRRAEDSSGNRRTIIIPEIFQAVHKEFLIPPWKDLSYDGPDYSDLVVNVLGFVPFGFCYFFHLQLRRPRHRAANFRRVVLVGAAVSLTIEIIQAWLPNRVSSTTDLLTNTLGALVGVVLAVAIRRQFAPAQS